MVTATDTVGKQDAGQILALVVCYLGGIYVLPDIPCSVLPR